jgi:hypothetical protein
MKKKIIQKTDVDNFNYKGHRHGYQEWYANAKLFYRGTYKNNLEVGYVEHNLYGVFGIGDVGTITEFYIR